MSPDPWGQHKPQMNWSSGFEWGHCHQAVRFCFLPEKKNLKSCHSVGCQELDSDLVSRAFDSCLWTDILTKESRMSPRSFQSKSGVSHYMCVCTYKGFFLKSFHLVLINTEFQLPVNEPHVRLLVSEHFLSRTTSCSIQTVLTDGALLLPLVIATEKYMIIDS